MMTPSSPNRCPECGKPVPAESLHQICPACLMAQALASRTIVEQGDPQWAAAVPPTPEEIADKFPQFDILECLGRGGMGVVYKGRQKSLNRLVAIKILAPERFGEGKFAERFAREAELLAKLNHPHIVTIHDFGETGGLFYLVMEFVDGVNLRDLLRDGKLDPQQALAIVPPICEALQYAHDKGIVHRDIKPENLLLDRDGRIKIADFGIAALVGAGGEVAGTPPYMAPEQSGNLTAVDHRADIYALGVVLYEMLTGERPDKELVAPSKKVRIDVRLDEIVLRALEKTPALRYQTAGILKTRIETILSETGSAGVPPAPVDVPSAGSPGTAHGGTPSAARGTRTLPDAAAATPAPPQANHQERLGKLALTLCLVGILPLVLSCLLPGHFTGHVTPAWMVIAVMMLATSLCELGAFVLGIVSWKSGAGKTAVIVSVLLPLLVVPGTGITYRMAGRSAITGAMAEEQSLLVEARNRAYLAKVEAVLNAETRKQLEKLRVRCDYIKWIVAHDRATAIMAHPQELRGEAGSNVWTNIDAELTARPVGDGYWEVRGDKQLDQARFTVQVPGVVEPLAALPEIESVVVSTDQAIVKQREFHGEGMIFTLGTMTQRWSPGSALFDHLFDVSIEWPWLRSHGANWVIKSRHGIHADYLLDDPPGQRHGKIVFHPGTPSPEADGSYVIGEFKSETGVVLPIAVRLVSDGKPHAPAQPARSPYLPARPAALNPKAESK